MAILVNPGGRLVQVDDPKEVENFLKMPGFALATVIQADEYKREREAIISQQRMPEITGKGIYLATVSQGGKDGYGVSSAKLIKELTQRDVIVKTHYDGQKVAILFHNPYSILKIESPYRIIYTMFESDKIPDDWKDYLDAADKVLVPSKWCQSVFKKAGVETEVVPLGYDDKVYTYKKRENKRKKRKDFTFLHYNAFNIRKGFPEVFKAFNQAFEKTEPVKMIFKTTLDQIPLPITKSEYPNIEIITGKTDEKELLKICERSDCFVFPSRGEGFGITPLEAMATGMPAIVPNAHGHTEYFNPEFMYEVKVKETCPAIYSKYKNMDVGNMVICDVDDLAKQMRYVYEHQDEAIEMGKKASEYVKQWTFSKTADKLKDVIDEAMKKDIADKPLRNALTLEEV